MGKGAPERGGRAYKHHATKLAKVAGGVVGTSKDKPAYTSAPVVGAIVVPGQKALAARAKKVLAPLADPNQ